jgi:hypothetical protein
MTVCANRSLRFGKRSAVPVTIILGAPEYLVVLSALVGCYCPSPGCDWKVRIWSTATFKCLQEPTVDTWTWLVRLSQCNVPQGEWLVVDSDAFCQRLAKVLRFWCPQIPCKPGVASWGTSPLEHFLRRRLFRSAHPVRYSAFDGRTLPKISQNDMHGGMLMLGRVHRTVQHQSIQMKIL